MCGILGLYNVNSSKSFDEGKFSSALQKILHRGPDSNEIISFGERLILGHVRLSIIDLSEQNSQPFQVDNRFYIVYNGEVYNYVELRNELINAGYQFRTEGDTEVILRAYQYWGKECVNRFNGMWAFAIFDKQDYSLFCSRDRFGIKPFYYSIEDGFFIFCSAIKPIIHYFENLKQPDYSIISNYCRKSIGAQTKETWFKNILRLEPAHNLTLNSDGIKTSRYWDYPKKVNSEITYNTAKIIYKDLLFDSICLRMRSDVPVGFTLSSGIDSTSIVSLVKGKFSSNKNTYTAAFSQTQFQKTEKRNFRHDISIDEPEIVRRLTKDLDMNSNIIEIDYNNYINELQRIVYHLESGHGSPAIFPLNQILKVAKNDVTVVLEGQGADELLGGYIIDVFPVFFLEQLRKLRIRKAFHELKIFLRTYSLKLSIMLYFRQSNLNFLKKQYYKLSGIENFFDGKLKSFKEINDFPNEAVDFDDKVNGHLYKSHTGCLVDLLHYGDAIPMAHSLESRLPFMDYRLVEFVFSLPSSYKIKEGKGKYIHREAMRGIVPDFILDNPVKLGFDSPLSEIFNNEGENSAMSILLSERCIARGLFSKRAILRAFKEQKRQKRDYSRILFRLLNVELWFREFID
ncbi:MAG TPA: asparagine synthase (glutamine-hydrolyzing) [Bacteroidales bacterium]|nr:asparagine synthase (glutamine-hydrolyzing) [Bacteroidales bacterium]